MKSPSIDDLVGQRVPDSSSHKLRVLVVAPTGRDASLICDLLARTSIECATLASVQDAEVELSSAGAVLLAEEALTPALVKDLTNSLAGQPPWSDLPLILLTVTGEVTIQSQRRRMVREPLGNVLLLERPVRPETLISTVRGALRARARQYQIRDQLAQFRQAEEALRKSEKLAVAGRLAASIAHEINNPLEAVTNLLYLMKTTTEEPQTADYLLLAEQELARVTEIAKQTLKFYREPSQHAPIDVAEVLDSVLQLYAGRILARNVTVHKELGSVAPVTARAGELRQLFANLIGNSLDAMRYGGQLRIRTRQCCDHGKTRGFGVRISVADTGTGIPQDLQGKIFEPFISTKGDTGTGLGLWVTSEIVQKYAGKIRVRSSVNPRKSGTVFLVFLPYKIAATA